MKSIYDNAIYLSGLLIGGKIDETLYCSGFMQGMKDCIERDDGLCACDLGISGKRLCAGSGNRGYNSLPDLAPLNFFWR